MEQDQSLKVRFVYITKWFIKKTMAVAILAFFTASQILSSCHLFPLLIILLLNKLVE